MTETYSLMQISYLVSLLHNLYKYIESLILILARLSSERSVSNSRRYGKCFICSYSNIYLRTDRLLTIVSKKKPGVILRYFERQLFLI